MDPGVASINDQVKDASAFAYRLREEIGTVVVGQRYLVDRLLIGLLANGHVLLEGVPGLAKTLSVKTLAQAVSATFRRIQFTPDLLPAEILATRALVDQIYIDDKVKEYVVNIVFATREPAAYQLDLGPLIQYGASPRATLYLTLAAKAHAFLQGRGYVTPQDVKSIGHDVLRHRVIVTYEAEAEEVDADEIVRRVFDGVPVP